MKKKLCFCEHCQKMVETDVVTRQETYAVREDHIQVSAKVRQCYWCSHDIYDDKLDNQTLIKVYDTYREKHKMVTWAKIAQAVESSGLTAEEVSELLSWQKGTIKRLLQGSLQSEKEDEVLKVFIESGLQAAKEWQEQNNPEYEIGLADLSEQLKYGVIPSKKHNKNLKAPWKEYQRYIEG